MSSEGKKEDEKKGKIEGEIEGEEDPTLSVPDIPGAVTPDGSESTSSNMNEVNKVVANYKQELEVAARKQREKLACINQDEQIIKRVVNENANPNPVVIACVFAGVMIAVWIIYAFMIKPDASGEWIDDKGGVWHLRHGMFGKMCGKYNGKSVSCAMSDNMFKCGRILGIWNYSDVIILVGGGNMMRVR